MSLVDRLRALGVPLREAETLVQDAIDAALELEDARYRIEELQEKLEELEDA